jgi:hypothetical protein
VLEGHYAQNQLRDLVCFNIANIARAPRHLPALVAANVPLLVVNMLRCRSEDVLASALEALRFVDVGGRGRKGGGGGWGGGGHVFEIRYIS